MYSPSVRSTSAPFQRARLVSSFSRSFVARHALLDPKISFGFGLGLGEFDHVPQPPDEDFLATGLGDEVDGAIVERHAFIGIQSLARGEKASLVLVAGYDVAGQEHDGQVDPVLAQLSHQLYTGHL